MNENMQQYLDKAQVLIEALPYIQRFNRKIIVVKYGGSAMVDEELKKRVIEDVTLLKLVGFKPIIVHGGGKEISKWVAKTGMEPRFINGLRVTDESTMEIAEMVLGRVNKSLVQLVESLGVRAIGISGKDGGLLRVDKKYSEGVETDPFLRAFFGDLSDRPSCYNCAFKKQYRVSDITIWDCFTIEDFDKKLDDDKGTTRILIHSKVGKKIFEKIKNKFYYSEINPEKLVNGVKEMYKSVKINLNRAQFWKDINSMKENEVIEKYFPINTLKVKSERIIRRTLSKTKFYKTTKKFVKKILRR